MSVFLSQRLVASVSSFAQLVSDPQLTLSWAHRELPKVDVERGDVIEIEPTRESGLIRLL